MTAWALVFLGVIGVAALVQSAVLIGLAVAGRRLSRRIEALQTRLERDVSPALRDLTRVSRNVAEISDIATLQARRLDLALADTIEKIEETTSVAQRLILRPLGPVADIVAFLKGLRRGIDVYFARRPPARPPLPRGRDGAGPRGGTRPARDGEAPGPCRSYPARSGHRHCPGPRARPPGASPPHGESRACSLPGRG